MRHISGWFVAIIMMLFMLGCGGSEYRFGNTQRILSSIAVTPGSQTLTATGQTAQFIATGSYNVDPPSQDLTGQAQWASSAPSVVTMSSGGLATAVGAGTATITATMNGVTGNAAVTVSVSGPPPTRTLTSITVIPSNQTFMTVGEPGQFLAIGNYDAAPLTADLTNQSTWTSSDTAVAIVNSGGLITAQSVGSATITALSSGVAGSSTVTITTNNYPHQLTALTVIPSDAETIVLGETVQYIAIGSFLGAPTTQDMTNQVKWISSDVRIATIDLAGLATAIGPLPTGKPNCGANGFGTTITALGTSINGTTIAGTANLCIDSGGPNNLPSLTVYEFGQGTGTVVSTPTGVTCVSGNNAGCTGHFVKGTAVTLTATPAPGSVFGGWSFNCQPPNGAPSGGSCTVKMGDLDDNDTVGAIFNLAP